MFWEYYFFITWISDGFKILFSEKNIYLCSVTFYIKLKFPAMFIS